MEFEEFKNVFCEKAKIVEININEEQIKKFYLYMKMILEWNEKINLTAIVDPKEIIIKHFIDSIVIAKYIKEGSSVIDIGTGAGFPGIPLKIIRPDIEIVLLDSLNKRIKFLDEVILKLKLEKVKTLHGRIEEIGKNKEYREKFDYSTSRAVANLAVLSEYMLPMVKVSGICISMKGSNVLEEVENAKKAIKVLGGKIKKIDEFLLCNTDIKRSIVFVEKEKNTPSKYPRKPGTPTKEPII